MLARRVASVSARSCPRAMDKVEQAIRAGAGRRDDG
ncbi:hypothetical protein HRbin23_00073 [bacterium HR23]|nr:hypothetical protein HRbin23_00073 [bacterium HR23]